MIAQEHDTIFSAISKDVKLFYSVFHTLSVL